MFSCTPVETLAQNFLVIGVAPTEGIALDFNTKSPGFGQDLTGSSTNFRYKDYFKGSPRTVTRR